MSNNPELKKNIRFPFEAENSNEFYTRENHKVDISSDVWILPISHRASKINFSKIKNLNLKTAIKECVIDQASRVSSISALNYFNDISRIVISRQAHFLLSNDITSVELEERLISLLEDAINRLREAHKLFSFYRVKEWYVWSSEVYPEIGFSEMYASEIDAMSIPGNPKGEAIRINDPEHGPLDRTLDFTRSARQIIMSKTERSKLYEGYQIHG